MISIRSRRFAVCSALMSRVGITRCGLSLMLFMIRKSPDAPLNDVIREDRRRHNWCRIGKDRRLALGAVSEEIGNLHKAYQQDPDLAGDDSMVDEPAERLLRAEFDWTAGSCRIHLDESVNPGFIITSASGYRSEIRGRVTWEKLREIGKSSRRRC